MASRRASLVPKDFTILIFGDGYLTLQSCIPVYHQLERDPSQVSRLLDDDDLLVKFLSDFDLYASRISQFFKQLKSNSIDQSTQKSRRRSTVGHGLPEELVQSFLLPLLGDDFEQFHSKIGFQDLFAAVIDFSLPFHARPLEALAKRLIDKEKFLEALVSGETSSKVMKEWTNSFSTTLFDVEIFEAWAKKFVNLCLHCDSNHGVSEQITVWRKLEDLKKRLVDVRQTCSSPKASKNLPLPKNMRKLRDTDKKSGNAAQKQGSGLQLSPEVLDLLQYFKIDKPASERALSNALDRLEKEETLKVLQGVLSSFPCRPCYSVSASRSANFYQEEEDWETAAAVAPEPSTDSILFTKFLGKGLGVWRVFLSSQALKDLEQSRFEGNFEHIEAKLVHLASGEWRRRSLCSPAGNPNERKSTQGTLYAAVYGVNGRILWQVDSGFDEESGRTMQLVKVWKIGDLKEISKSIPNIIRIQKTYSPSQMAACKLVLFDEPTGRNLPAECSVISNSNTTEISTGVVGSDRDNRFLSDRVFYTLTQTVIDNLVSQNLCAEFPLVPSEEELGIIKNNKTSTLILGRSGTGKTTCLVYKLFGRYMTGNMMNIGRPRRQVLLTRSRVLSNKLELYTKRLIDTQLNRASTTPEEEDLQHTLAQEDREVTDTIFSIKDEDFPLVCTFDHFMKLLENTTRFANRQDFSASKKNAAQKSNKSEFSMGKGHRRLLRKSHLVDFSVFSAGYWESFSSEVTKRIPVALAFIEIIGVIKGSASASNNFQPLGRDEYRIKGPTISPTFITSGDRDLIYDMYENYEKRRHQLGDLDDTDRVRSVLDAISNNPELREKIESVLDEIYVDEIQDQRLLEIELLLRLIKSPLAIHFAGDTAQCISKDSAFRFQNVKALFFEHFSVNSTLANNPELARPRLCELYKNYRTHQGILSLATRVMRLLYQTFPGMVDKLRDEVGQQGGPKPIVFVGLGSDIFSSRMFGITDLNADNEQFGAEQVIIVRDTAEKEKLKAEIGQVALILTVLESKGMEFDDVLLHDFFATSPCISAFRSLALSKSFDEMKHIALCAELKQFYVAITRARSRLWLFESDEGAVRSVLKVLAVKDSGPGDKSIAPFEVVHANDINLDHKLKELRPATTTDPRAWSTKGHEFMHKKDYENALYCYERAKNPQGKLSARAYMAEKKGNDYLANGEDRLSEKYFHEAIELFRGSKLPLREAACYEALGMFEPAADILSKNEEYSRAAELYDKIDFFEKAAENYRRAGRYNDGATILRRGDLFEKLVYYLNDNSAFLDPSCRLHYSKLCNLLLKRGQIPSKLEGLTRAALGSDKEKEAFFLEYEMSEQLFSFYVDKGRFLDAFNYAFKNGDLKKASRIAEHHYVKALPPQEMRNALCYTEAQRLYSRISAEPGQIFPPDRPLPTVYLWKPEVLSIKGLWEALEKVLDGLWKREISYESIRFNQPWMKQFMDIVITFKAPDLINSAKDMTELPIDSINEVLSMIKKLDSLEELPFPLLLFLGVFPHSKETKSYKILDWSPLRIDSLPNSRILEEAKTMYEITRWGLHFICRAIDQLHGKAFDLYKDENPIRCAHFVTTGNCSNNPCQFSHKAQTMPGYEITIDNLLRMNSIFCNLLQLYYRQSRDPGLMDDDFASSFRGRQRKWLETLLSKITYASTFENAPKVLMNTRRDIVKNNPQFFGVYGGLESLLFHKLRKQWEEMCNFSSMLEQMELAEILGVKGSFERFLKNEVRYRRYLPGAEQTYGAWKTLENVQYLCESGHINRTSIDRILGMAVQRFELHEFSSFHAVCSLYEKMATYLIFMSNPTTLLLPNGWVEMYLLQMPWLLAQKDHSQSSYLRPHYQDTLLALLQNFCYLLQRISEQDLKPKFSGRPRRSEFLIRRNVDFLVVCLVNAYSWRLSHSRNFTLANKYHMARTLVQKTFNLKLSRAPSDFRDCAEYVLARNFISSFDKFYEKDYPVILAVDRSTKRFFEMVLEGIEVPLVTLEEIHSLSTPQKESATIEGIKEMHDEEGDYTQKELHAAEKIKWMWKTRYPIIQKRREFSKTPVGKDISIIQRLCKKVLEGRSLDSKQKLRRRAVLFSDGFDTLQDAKPIGQQYRKIKGAIKSRIDNPGLVSTNLMEVLQGLWENQSAIEGRIRDSVNFLTEKHLQNLGDVGWQQLSSRCVVAKSTLKKIGAHLLEIDLELHALDNPEDD